MPKNITKDKFLQSLSKKIGVGEKELAAQCYDLIHFGSANSSPALPVHSLSHGYEDSSSTNSSPMSFSEELKFYFPPSPSPGLKNPGSPGQEEQDYPGLKFYFQPSPSPGQKNLGSPSPGKKNPGSPSPGQEEQDYPGLKFYFQPSPGQNNPGLPSPGHKDFGSTDSSPLSFDSVSTDSSFHGPELKFSLQKPGSADSSPQSPPKKKVKTQKKPKSLKKLNDFSITECEGIDASLRTAKRIGNGGYGQVYLLPDGTLLKKALHPKMENPSEKSDCLEGRGCKNELLLEALIMRALGELNCEHFVKFENLYECAGQYYLVMENLGHSTTFTAYVNKKRLSREARLSILFQITYALYLAHEEFQFVHGDLIGENIMIQQVPREMNEYTIGPHVYKFDNCGLRVVIIDFGFSRLKYEGISLYQTYLNPEDFKDDRARFNGAADVCKVYKNPTIIKDLNLSEPLINGKSLSSILARCKEKQGNTWQHVFVQPFPRLKAVDVLLSSLFDSLM